MKWFVLVCWRYWYRQVGMVPGWLGLGSDVGAEMLGGLLAVSYCFRCIDAHLPTNVYGKFGTTLRKCLKKE
ncbi:MAG: hypothetical protein R2769_10305 [Saprospiraceae bacterium]